MCVPHTWIYVWQQHFSQSTFGVNLNSEPPMSILREAERKRALYLVALLLKMICNLGDPMSLRHPVSHVCIHESS